MEATTLCALMLKAKKVFAKEQTFLSFPISPLPYTPRQLDFFDQSSAAALLESIHHRKEFSTLVDAVATGEAWQPAGDTRLSETYAEVLDTAEIAASSRTAPEEAEYQAARAVLRTEDRDSDKLIAYRQCRDAYLLAEQRFTAASLTAHNAGSEEKMEWQHTTAPLLRRELAELLQAWMFEGFKEEIETAQVQVATLGARSPSLTWADWRGRYNPDIDSLNDPLDGTSVMPSGFSPSNAISNEAWRSFTLSPPEVTALLQDAPPAWLATMLGATPPQASQAITFEFSSAAIVRPWFDSALFKARFWKFSESDRKLSDGKSPATGECPAYVAALVFARKVSVTGGSTAPAPGGLFEGFHFTKAAHLAQSKVLKREITPLTDPALEQPQEIPPHHLIKRRRVGQAMPFAAARMAGRNPASIVSHVSLLTAPAPRIMETAATPALSRTVLSAHAFAQFERLKIFRSADHVQLTMPLVFVPMPPIAPAPAPSPATSPVPSPTANADTIYVLAFICKPLPQCPNPDSDLQW